MQSISTGYVDIDDFMKEVESTIVKSWTDEIASYFIVYRKHDNTPYSSVIHQMDEYIPKGSGKIYYCGYCVFEKPLFSHEGYQGLSSAKIHGGVTFGKRFSDGIQLYGFDCTHSGDKDNERCFDINWLTKECEKMSREIIRIYQEVMARSN